ncbi:MAG: nucleotide excision repair endonuclease, partial [Candidatus Eisenbacteria bacterium]|nr:nucleotide excision repair endonuclease [Candidatus Eisenbacteria bacterium]
QATEIARRFLRVQDPRPSTAGPIVRALLAEDPRFVSIGTQLWAAAPEDAASDSASYGEEALLFGVAKRSASDARAFLYGFLRVQSERETGSLVFARRRGDRGGLPPPLERLARGATLAIFRAREPFRLLDPGGSIFSETTLRLRAWASGLFLAEETRTPESLAATLGLRATEGDDPLFEARLLHSIHARLLEIRGCPEPEETASGSGCIPFLREGGETFLAGLPDRPGVYRMRDRSGKLLYVGKSRSLRARVESYFRGFAGLPEEKKDLVRLVARIETEVVGSEAEALLREWRSIRRKRPPYNEKIEVRAEPSPVVRGKDLVLFLPSTDARCVTLFLLRADGAMRRLRARRNATRVERLAGEIERFFRGEGGTREEGGYALLSRWIEEERDRLTLVDASRHADAGDLLRVVRECLADPDVASGKRVDRI